MHFGYGTQYYKYKLVLLFGRKEGLSGILLQDKLKYYVTLQNTSVLISVCELCQKYFFIQRE